MNNNDVYLRNCAEAVFCGIKLSHSLKLNICQMQVSEKDQVQTQPVINLTTP